MSIRSPRSYCLTASPGPLEALRALLSGGGLGLWCWPFAFVFGGCCPFHLPCGASLSLPFPLVFPSPLPSTFFLFSFGGGRFAFPVPLCSIIHSCDGPVKSSHPCQGEFGLGVRGGGTWYSGGSGVGVLCSTVRSGLLASGLFLSLTGLGGGGGGAADEALPR